MRFLHQWLAPITIIVLATLFLLLWENPPTGLMPAGLFGPQPKPTPAAVFPVSVLSNSTHRSFDENGQLASVIRAKKSRHFQVNPKHSSAEDYTQIEQPRMILYRADDSPWRATAKQANSRNNAALVELIDEVILWQIDAQGERSELTSSYLAVRPQQQFVETDKPVTIRSPGEITRATGMRAFLEQDRFQLLSEVRGIYEPQN